MSTRYRQSHRSTERRMSNNRNPSERSLSTESLQAKRYHNRRSSSQDEGSRMTVDMNDIRRRLDRLRAIEKHPIRLLVGQSRDDYIALVNITRLLYGTSLYSEYYSEIVQRFGNIAHIQPGTVGAYFVGCLPQIEGANEKFNHTCSAICANAIPTPDMMENGGKCDNEVFLASVTDVGYDFIPLITGDYNHAIVFVDGSFSGFTSSEKEKLRRYVSPSVKTISIYRVSPDGKHYTDISHGRLSFDEIPTRVEMIENFPTKYTSDVSSNTKMYLAIIALLVLLIFLAWYFLF